MSHFHYFLESEFGYTDVRDLDFTWCKRLLKSQLDDPGLLFYIAQSSNFRSESVPQLKSFDC